MKYLVICFLASAVVSGMDLGRIAQDVCGGSCPHEAVQRARFMITALRYYHLTNPNEPALFPVDQITRVENSLEECIKKYKKNSLVNQQAFMWTSSIKQDVKFFYAGKILTAYAALEKAETQDVKNS
jgi:hypothetical protein